MVFQNKCVQFITNCSYYQKDWGIVSERFHDFLDPFFSDGSGWSSLVLLKNSFFTYEVDFFVWSLYAENVMPSEQFQEKYQLWVDVPYKGQRLIKLSIYSCWAILTIQDLRS